MMKMTAFGFSEMNMMETIERIYEANDEYLHDAVSFVEQKLEEHDAGMKQMMAITVAVEEIFVNIAHYAYENMDPGQMKIVVSFEGDDVIITFRDHGIPFNPLAKEDPDVKASAEERQIGGLGIYMVKKSMDHCEYERKDNENIFTMRKAIR